MTGKKPLGLATLIILAAVLGLVLRAHNAETQQETSSRVRMPVDSTVLPPIEAHDTTADDAPKEPPLEEESLTPPTPPTEETADSAPASSAKETPAAPASPAQPETAKAAPQQQGNGTIKSIELNSTDTGFTITLAMDQTAGDTSYMNLQDPKRLVLDLRQHWNLKTPNVIRANSGMVKHIVIGEHPDRLRLVVHFRSPPKAQLTPAFSQNEKNLVITVVQP